MACLFFLLLLPQPTDDLDKITAGLNCCGGGIRLCGLDPTVLVITTMATMGRFDDCVVNTDDPSLLLSVGDGLLWSSNRWLATKRVRLCCR
jgi:hypothetical protein